VINHGILNATEERGKRFRTEQIIPKPREGEVDLAKGLTMGQVRKKIGVVEQTCNRWRKEYGGLRMDQAKRLKNLVKESSRLKCLLAGAELDKAILREAASGSKYRPPAPETIQEAKSNLAMLGWTFSPEDAEGLTERLASFPEPSQVKGPRDRDVAELNPTKWRGHWFRSRGSPAADRP
jgi:putative transposase